MTLFYTIFISYTVHLCIEHCLREIRNTDFKDVYQLIEKKQETTRSSLQACLVIAHSSGDVLLVYLRSGIMYCALSPEIEKLALDFLNIYLQIEINYLQENPLDVKFDVWWIKTHAVDNLHDQSNWFMRLTPHLNSNKFLISTP